MTGNGTEFMKMERGTNSCIEPCLRKISWKVIEKRKQGIFPSRKAVMGERICPLKHGKSLFHVKSPVFQADIKYPFNKYLWNHITK